MIGGRKLRHPMLGTLALAFGAGASLTATASILPRLDAALPPAIELAASQPMAPHMFSGAETKNFISGKHFTFYDESIIDYYTNSQYVYQGTRGKYTGQWYISGDQVCVRFSAGFKRCDNYGFDGKDYFVQNKKKQQYPIKTMEDIK